jgi:hypothetical protein
VGDAAADALPSPGLGAAPRGPDLAELASQARSSSSTRQASASSAGSRSGRCAAGDGGVQIADPEEQRRRHEQQRCPRSGTAAERLASEVAGGLRDRAGLVGLEVDGNARAIEGGHQTVAVARHPSLGGLAAGTNDPNEAMSWDTT